MIPSPYQPASVASLFNTALHFHRQHDFNRARELYAAVLQLQPDHPDTLYLTSILCYQTGQHEQAVLLIRRSFEVDPRQAEVYLKLGVLMQDNGRIEEAIHFFQQALLANTNTVENLYRLSQIFVGGGYLDEAINCLRDIVQLNPNIAGIHQSLGLLYLRKGMLNEAITSFHQAILLNARDASAYKNLGVALLAVPEPQLAIDMLHQAITLDSTFSTAYSLLGNTYRSQGQLSRALEIYRLARKIFPSELEYLNDIGLTYLAMKQWPKAATCFQELIALSPEMDAAHFNLGLAYQNQARFLDAVDTYKQAVAWNPANVAACNNLAQVYLQLDNEPAAREWYQRVVELDPANHAAQHIVDALSGTTTDIAPREYVISLFDQYSDNFDHELVRKLDYHVPNKLLQATLDHLGTDISFANAVDLGCGTGMAGQEFRRFTGRMTGVDLSGKMLDKARQKNIYDALCNSDVTDFLINSNEKFDLVIATDVFIYLGKLEPIFAAVQRHSQPGGYFAFSIETCPEEQDYVLCPSGRYAQSRRYIETLAKSHGFIIERCQATGIRKEKECWLMGELYILKRLAPQKKRVASQRASPAVGITPLALPFSPANQDKQLMVAIKSFKNSEKQPICYMNA